MEINTIRINNPFNYKKHLLATEKDLFRNANYGRATDFYLNNDLIMLYLYLDSCIATYDFEYNIQAEDIKQKVMDDYVDEIIYNEKLIAKVARLLIPQK